jgi:repressor LexA
VVARVQRTAHNGEIIVAGIPGDEATVKTYTKKGNTVTLLPATQRLSPMPFHPNEVTIYGKVVTVIRKVD